VLVIYPHVKHCGDVRHALTGGSCWFISFSPVVREPSIQSVLSEMEWGTVGKQLQSHFLLSVFCVCGKTNNTDVKIHIFLPHYSHA
jgi:hypothetical protein